MTKIKYLIFDFGGVFVTEAFREIRKEFGDKLGIDMASLWEGKMKPYWKEIEKGQITENQFWDIYERTVNVPSFKADEMRRVFYSKNNQKNTEIVDFILNARKKGYTTALLTNNVREWLEDFDRKDHFNQYFDEVLSSHEVNAIKPEPEIYNIMLERLRARPEECIFVDDKRKNVDAAINLGMKGVLCIRPEKAVREICDLLENGD